MDFSEVANFFLFWQTVGFAKLVRFFWYAILLEFPRYVIFDAILLTAHYIKSVTGRKEKALSRGRLLKERRLVSVIIPGKNEGENIYRLVRSLREQTYRNMEIIVVDDGSDDDTPRICKSLRENGFLDLYLRNDVRGGKASASNMGLRYAKGDFVLLLDADSSFDRDAVEKILLPFYMDGNIGAVGGNIKVRNHDDSVCTSLQAIEYIKTISVGRAVASMLGIYRVVPGAFGAFRKDILQRIGGWDVGPGLDGDITIKIRKLGYKIHFEMEAVCFTTVPGTYPRLTKQRLRWYKSIIRFRIRKHRDVYFPNEGFRVSNFASFIENTFFNIVMDLKWIIYMVDVLYNFPTLFKYIVPMNYLLYVGFNLVQFMIATILSERRKQDFKLFVYLPLVPLYTGVYLRIVRTTAYIQELLFKTSYRDPWNPWKVSKRALKEKL